MRYRLQKGPSAIIVFLFFSHQLSAQSDCLLTEDPVVLNTPTLVGNGTAASCTQVALQTALDSGGEIQCNCGTGPVTIVLNAPLLVSQNTILDGGEIVLDGDLTFRIIDKAKFVDFTVQNLTLRNGKAPGPAGHFSNECGGAILSRGAGILKVINCDFEGNTVTSINGSDIAGGGVYVFGEQKGIFSDCRFTGNSASNGGAIGGLGSDIIITNCIFSSNSAEGNTGGIRGHGGAIYLDGVEIAAADKVYSVCGSSFLGNNAYNQGGASCTVFSDNVGAKLEMDQCNFEGNFLRAADAGNGGAIFHVVDDFAGGFSETQFTVTRSSFIKNHCNRQGGGIWAYVVGLGVIENCTFYKDSTAHPNHGLGGAMSLLVSQANQGGYLIRNNTFAQNYAGLWAGGVFANTVAPISWQNNILFENETSHSNIWLDVNVNRTMNVDLGGNLQWPSTNPSGGQATMVTPTVVFENAQLSLPPTDLGGPTPSILLQNSSSAINNGTNCPPTDQRLVDRNCFCDIGAYAFTTPVDSMMVTGIQSGNQTHIAGIMISSTALITPLAHITFMACQASFLNPGFEVQTSGELEVQIQN